MNSRRRYERRAARRYAHNARRFSKCDVGLFCLPCLWRSVTGVHRKRKAALIAHGRANLEVVRNCSHVWVPFARADRIHSRCAGCGAVKWRA